MLPDTLLPILACPDCGGSISRTSEYALKCDACGRSYEITHDGILCMLPLEAKSLPDAYNDPDYIRMSENFDDSSSYFTEGNSIFRAIQESSHQFISKWREARSDMDGWTCDIGCGQGYHYRYFKDLSKVIGLDIRLESLRKIRALFPDAILIQANSCALPLKDQSVSAITSVYALEHIYFLDDALAETARILSHDGTFYVGIPCEGGLAWTLGREVTSMRTMSKRYNVNYRKYIKLEHCNTAAHIVDSLNKFFHIERKRLFPLPFIPLITANLTATLRLKRR